MTTKLFRITEDDLALLESEMPRLMDSALDGCNDAVTRKRWKALKDILSNVRWDYGPPEEVERINPS